MKSYKNKIFFLFPAIFLLMLKPVHAQNKKTSTATKEDKCTNELIMGVPKVSEKNLFVLTSAIPKIKGIKYVDFCEKDKLLLLKYDKDVYSKQEDVIKAFHEQNIVMPMIIKSGTFEGVKELCVKKETN